MAYTKYSLTPADNNAAPPNGAPEGMLPSAVNDTMRDMMSQIRDVGDGIRGGTYTMTAPVITGGSITGVALSGNTLTNPVITGGSINNTTVGATTRSTGAFTTLASNGATTFTAGTASTSTTTGTAVITGGLGVSGRINAANFDGIVGANTAAAGNFTTLGATGVATFSAGTVSAPAITTTGDTNTGIYFPAADTIAFTEGGVESMRIDSAGNVGIGLTSPFARLDLGGATTGQTLLFSNSGTNGTARLNMRIAFRTGSLGTVTNLITSDITGSFDDSSDLRFYTGGGSERMRITSAGNVGIGTSSSSFKTTIQGNENTGDPANPAQLSIESATAFNTNPVSGIVFRNKFNSGGSYAGMGGIIVGKSNATDGDYASYLALTTRANGANVTERMRIDASGNLGLGVTPSAWSGNVKAMQVGAYGSIWSGTVGGTPYSSVYANAFWTGTQNTYLTSTFSTAYHQTVGQHQWLTAPSGTAGNAITFTQAMTLDSSGNLGVGTTTITGAANTNIQVKNSAAAALRVTGGAGTGFDVLQASDSVAYLYNRDNTATVFGTNNLERMRITSAGVVELAQGQIKFPATQVASADANTLDDYEEGTWTAAFVPTGGTITINASYRTGKYVKVGSKVTVTGIFIVSAISSPTGALTMSGLPFTSGSADSNNSAPSIHATDLAATATTALQGRLQPSQTSFTIARFSGGNQADLASSVTASTQFVLSLTYFV